MTQINNAVQMIYDYYNYYSLIERIYKLHYESHVSQASYINNYKDALMHLRKMYKNKENAQILNEQLVLVSEHLSRGIVDIYIEILKDGSFVLLQLYVEYAADGGENVSKIIKA